MTSGPQDSATPDSSGGGTARPRPFDWILEREVAASSYPRDAEHLQALHNAGVRVLVSLHALPLDPAALAAAGLEARHSPVPDFSSPTLTQIAEIIAFIDAQLAQRRPVAVHCAAGLGRTGTVVACYLVHRGYPPSDAIATVRARRPGSVQTAAQVATVYEYAHTQTRRRS